MTKLPELQNEKICFVIMPISDTVDYPPDHFRRVYEHLIKPACKKAGFEPLRADDIQETNFIMADILKSILTAEMAICDLSGKNPNVLFELGIRQAYNLPVTLIKDNKTDRVFDIQGIRDIQYDDSLRIDIVEQKIIEIAETILKTYESKDKEMSSLIQLLKIKPAKLQEEIEISQETNLILEQLKSLNEKINKLEKMQQINNTQQEARIYRGLEPGIFNTNISPIRNHLVEAYNSQNIMGHFEGTEKSGSIGGKVFKSEVLPNKDLEK